MLLSHELLSPKFSTHHFTYFIGVNYLFQDHFKNAKMMKILQVHQKLQAKQFFTNLFNCYLLETHLNLMRLKKHD